MGLLWQRRFAPLFWVQFLGAFNDNLLKNALLVMASYGTLQLGRWKPEQVVPVSAGLFILPFVLLSVFAGQAADKFRKSDVIRTVKRLEVVIMALAGYGFLRADLLSLWAALFLMGCHSACFGPVKYGVLPELLPGKELMRGNAWIEAGTFVAIVAGTLAGGLLSGIGPQAPLWVATSGFAVALLGALIAEIVPVTAASQPELRLYFGFGPPLREATRAIAKDRVIIVSVIGIAWFWFLGAALLTLLPLYGRQVLFANEQVVSALLAVFCVGIGVGSALCGVLAHRGGGMRWTLVGGLGIGWFLFDLSQVHPLLQVAAGAPLRGVASVLSISAARRAVFDLSMLSLCGGLFSVPLFTAVQQRAPQALRARIIAANNLLSALLMTAAAVLLFAMLARHCSFSVIFGLFAVLHALMIAIALWAAPELRWRGAQTSAPPAA